LNEKRFLGAVFSLQLVRGKAKVRDVAVRTGCGAREASSMANRLEQKGLLGMGKNGISLTEKGRESIKVVFIGGGFEIIHPGHIYTVDQAKRLGDVLVAVVARDSTIRRRKGREPVAGEADRVGLLSSLRQVDAAILGAEGDIYRTLQKVGPDVVALGYDQHHAESDIRSEAAKRGIRLEVVRLDTHHPKIKTTRLLRET
jgi:cytidyltransferase-like protein